MHKSLLLTILLAAAVPAKAGTLEQLQEISETIPTSEMDQRVSEYLKRELPGTPALQKSHYTVALFEDLATASEWYIVDGYYELKTGEILFLDFVYYPESKTWRVIRNYAGFVNEFSMRYLLQADEICNPYLRHYIGVLQGFSPTGIDALLQAFADTFGQRPNLQIDSWGNIFVYDSLNDDNQPNAFIALKEQSIVAALATIPKLPDLTIIKSGRAPSDDKVRKTYLPVGTSCH